MKYLYTETECKLSFTVKSENLVPTEQEILTAALNTLRGLNANKELIAHQVKYVNILDAYDDVESGMKVHCERYVSQNNTPVQLGPDNDPWDDESWK